MFKNILNSNHKRVAIIGAGAAGLMAAVFALKEGFDVTVFERGEKVGRKFALTGNGRCNFTNRDLSLVHYKNSILIQDVLSAYDCDALLGTMKELGILWTEERGGYFYPVNGKALAVVETFVSAIIAAGGQIKTGCLIHEITATEDSRFEIKGKEQGSLGFFDIVILACGGKAAPKTGSDGFGFRLARSFGHKVSNTYPVLVQLCSNDKLCASCNGVRIKAKAVACIDGVSYKEESGELQITDYGLSGIITFQLSRVLCKPLENGNTCEIILDFLPDYTMEEMKELLKQNLFLSCESKIIDVLQGYSNRKIIDYILKKKRISPEQKVSVSDTEMILDLIQTLKHYSVRLCGHKGYENAQATQGGVILDEVTEYLESRFIKNLYFAGEMLDVDGDCGGYNLHWAFASAARVVNAIKKEDVI